VFGCGVGCIVRSILRVCHAAAPLQFLVGYNGHVHQQSNPSCQDRRAGNLVTMQPAQRAEKEAGNLG
jgi:hypothetical protein